MIKKYVHALSSVRFLAAIRTMLLNLDPIQRQSLISGVVTLAISVLGFFSTIYFAHTVGAPVLGMYFLFLAYYSIFNFIGDGGFGGAANKRFSEGKEKNELYSAYISVKIGLLFVSVFLFVLAIPILSNYGNLGIELLTIAALVFGVFSDIAITGVYGMGKLGITQLSMLVNNVLRIVLQVAAIFLGFGILGLVGGFILGTIVGTVFNLYFLKFRFTSFSFSHLKNLYSYAIWSFLSSGGLIIFSYADTILIAAFMNTADVGIYRTSYNLTAMAGFAVLSFQYVLFPKISSWWTNGKVDSILSTVSLSIYFSLALTLPFCVGGWILGDRLLYFLYGSSFASGYLALSILLAVQIVNVYMVMLSTTLNALNRPNDTFKVTLITSVLLIVLDLIFIPRFGIAGAAISVLITYALNSVFSYYLLSRYIRIPFTLSKYNRIFVATACMGIVVIAYRILIPLSNVVLAVSAVVLGAAVYGAILLATDKTIKNQITSILVQTGLQPKE